MRYESAWEFDEAARAEGERRYHLSHVCSIETCGETVLSPADEAATLEEAARLEEESGW